MRIQKQQLKAERLRKQLERAEEKLRNVMKAGMKRKRGNNDSGDENGPVQDSEEAKVGPASASEASSDSSDESDSDDEPETATSRRTAPTKAPPSGKKNMLDRNCKYFSTGGTCGKMGKCRFVHDQAVRDAALREQGLAGSRPTLYQRLVEAEQKLDDLSVVKAVQNLHKQGELAENEPSAPPASDQSAPAQSDQGVPAGSDERMPDGSEDQVMPEGTQTVGDHQPAPSQSEGDVETQPEDVAATGA
jgi:hypothetical protein